jgi:hypothetical protein
MDDFERMMDELNQLIANERKNFNIQIDNEKLNAFKGTISELINIKNEYEDKLLCFRNIAESEIVNYEYSKGGETIHRGYYCPSLIYDLIVGNAKRGRRLKRKPEFGKYSYEYGFDLENRLLRVKNVNEFTTPDSRFNEEYLVYNNDIVYGVEFNNMGSIEFVSKSTYENGNIVKYECSVCGTRQYATLYYEEYFYENNMLSEVSIFDVTPQIELYEEQKYKIELNDEGNIVRLIGGFVNNGVWEQDILNFTN